MNEYSYEQERKGLNSFIVILLAIFITAGAIAALFTNYKQETLICSKSQNTCYLQKTNLVNIKSRKELVKYNDIKTVAYIPRSAQGNMYAKGYTYYHLVFMTKNKENIQIFTTNYYEKDEVKDAVEAIKNLMKKNDDVIEFERN